MSKRPTMLETFVHLCICGWLSSLLHKWDHVFYHWTFFHALSYSYVSVSVSVGPHLHQKGHMAVCVLWGYLGSFHIQCCSPCLHVVMNLHLACCHILEGRVPRIILDWVCVCFLITCLMLFNMHSSLWVEHDHCRLYCKDHKIVR